MRTLQSAESEFNRALRNVDMATEAYQTYRKAAEDRRVKRAQETQVKIQVVDPPTIPFRPLGMGKLLLALAAILFAFAVAVGLALLLHMVAIARANIRDPRAQDDEKLVSAPRSARAG
jgi:uncharacterized protein involved in exopolysaccharide biosynthesis